MPISPFGFQKNKRGGGGGTASPSVVIASSTPTSSAGTFYGTLSNPGGSVSGQTIKILKNSTALSTVTTDSSGNWTYSFSGLANGDVLSAAWTPPDVSANLSAAVIAGLPTAFMLLQFDDAGTWTASGGAAITSDTTNKLSGTASMALEGNGVSGNNPIATKTSAFTGDPSTFDVIAWAEYYDNYPHASAVFPQFGRGGTYVGLQNNNEALGNYPGWIWRAVHVSEIAGLQTGSAATDVRMRITQNAPYNNRIKFDSMIRNAKGRPSVIFSFDDNENTMYTFAKPLMDTYGIKGTAFVAPGGASGVGVSDSLTEAQLGILYNAGWDLACNGGYDDTVYLTSWSDPTAAVTSLNTVRQWLVDRGWTRAKDHLCYNNGYFNASSNGQGSPPTPVQIAALTGNGTTTVTFGAAVTVQNGWTVHGNGIPLNTTIVSGGGTGVTSVVLSNAVPAQTKAAAVIDETHPFYMGKLQAALASAGYKTGRTTLGGNIYNRFGFGDQALVLPGTGVSGFTYAQMKARVDEALLRGTTVYFYMHRITSAGGGINISEADFTSLINYVGGLKNSGLIDTPTISEFYNTWVNGAANIPT